MNGGSVGVVTATGADGAEVWPDVSLATTV
jgi:hypothetical protein